MSAKDGAKLARLRPVSDAVRSGVVVARLQINRPVRVSLVGTSPALRKRLKGRGLQQPLATYRIGDRWCPATVKGVLLRVIDPGDVGGPRRFRGHELDALVFGAAAAWVATPPLPFSADAFADDDDDDGDADGLDVIDRLNEDEWCAVMARRAATRRRRRGAPLQHARVAMSATAGVYRAAATAARGARAVVVETALNREAEWIRYCVTRGVSNVIRAEGCAL